MEKSEFLVKDISIEIENSNFSSISSCSTIRIRKSNLFVFNYHLFFSTQKTNSYLLNKNFFLEFYLPKWNTK